MNGVRILAELPARLLACDEREAVLGDLAEAGESAWRSLLDVLGLVLRRQWMLWKDWRPWLAGFGVALPFSFILMGISVSISLACQRAFSGGIPGARMGLHEPGSFLCQAVLLFASAWTGGFVVGSLSRRTLWVSVALCFCPCLFCLSRFRIEPLSRLCLLLFLVPAIAGVHYGLRALRVRLRATTALAAAATLSLAILSSRHPIWIADWILIWPAWHLAAAARRRETPS